MSTSAKDWAKVVAERPQDWAVRPFGDVFTERTERNGDGLPLLSVTAELGVVRQEAVGRRDVSNGDKSKYKKVSAGDIAYNTMRMWQGRLGLCKEAGLVSPAYTVITPKDDDPIFLTYLLKNPQLVARFRAMSQGLVDDTLSLKFAGFSVIETLLPPLWEQKKIAAILTAVDEAIEATQAVIDQLQVVKSALMSELLTRGLPGRHTHWIHTPLGRRPSSWRVCQVQEIGRVDSGKAIDKRLNAPKRPYLRVANVFDGRIDFDDVYEMPMSDDEFHRLKLEFGDVLLNEGQSIELVGRCAMFECSRKDVAFQNALIRFRAADGISARWAEYYFRWCQTSGKFAEIATRTTTIAHLGLRRFAAMLIALPPLEEARAIAEAFIPIDGTLKVNTQMLTSLQSVKRSLAELLLSGGVRVAEVSGNA